MSQPPDDDTKWWQRPSNNDDDYGVEKFKTSLRKTQRLTFFCNLCRIDLNSVETRKSHVDGRQHQLALHQAGLTSENDDDVVQEIPNPVHVRKKDPEGLVAKIKHSEDPVVGLRYLTEYVPASDLEQEPYYTCDLCDNEGEASSMLCHIMGRKHRAAYLTAKDPSSAARFEAMPSRELMSRAAYAAENRKLHRLKTVKGDITFPWPAGKAPWAIEQGGEGVAPPGAVHRGNLAKNMKALKKEKDAGDEAATESSLVGPIPPLPDIKDMGEMNCETLDMFVDFGNEVAGKLLKRHEETGARDLRVTTLCDQLRKDWKELGKLLEESAAAASARMKEEALPQPEATANDSSAMEWV